ncbi:Ribonuclease 3 [Flavobacteriales bacterium]|nr:Ribonuclease 3 [Flavobacteriales bacterium]MCL4815407.1 ribonuclease III [Flavobacteriales bacterium]WKZ75026.1 MAG: ribonuclease III [Vicingaceae bacterium]GIK69968.1 MAG: hypothetical protein BroJett020_12630 [Bacteroidota bacterium]CAG0959543.1 Ribonuclease 3 [Flavobacteriales bacterium]
MFSNTLYSVIGIFPKNISLYKQAFRHTSAAKEIKNGVKDSYERLEFLGDAILGSVIAHYFFSKFPVKDEGYLTKMRSRMVSRTYLNQLSVKMGIHTFIELKGDLGRSVYGDVLEALIGAIYLDKGYKKTRGFVIQHIVQNYVNLEELINTETDFKSKLIEISQKERMVLEFKSEEIAVKNGNKIYNTTMYLNGKIESTGTGFSKKNAEQEAAKMYFEKKDSIKA